MYIPRMHSHKRFSSLPGEREEKKRKWAYLLFLGFLPHLFDSISSFIITRVIILQGPFYLPLVFLVLGFRRCEISYWDSCCSVPKKKNYEILSARKVLLVRAYRPHHFARNQAYFWICIIEHLLTKTISYSAKAFCWESLENPFLISFFQEDDGRALGSLLKFLMICLEGNWAIGK